MGSERCHLRSHHPAEAPAEILRVGQERGRLFELSRVAALVIEDVAPEIEAPRQMGRSRLVEGRTRRIIVGVDSGKSIELIVERRERRAVVAHEDARTAVCRGRDRLDGKPRAKLLERAHEESPGAFRVEPEIRPFKVRRERRVRRGALGENRAAPVEDDDFDVGLADVEDRNAAAHASIRMERVGGRRRALGRAVIVRTLRRLSTP